MNHANESNRVSSPRSFTASQLILSKFTVCVTVASSGVKVRPLRIRGSLSSS